MQLGVLGVVMVAALILVLIVFWVRTRRFSLGPTLRIDLRNGFPVVRRNGYDSTDVDALMDRVYGLAASEEGRAEALELTHSARFGLARRAGYDSRVVDLHVDAMLVALQTGRELPPRPGYR
jgi:hypothetical protein